MIIHSQLVTKLKFTEQITQTECLRRTVPRRDKTQQRIVLLSVTISSPDIIPTTLLKWGRMKSVGRAALMWKNCIKILVKKSEEKYYLAKSGVEDNIKLDPT